MTAEVEQVLAEAAEAGAISLSVVDGSEAVLDGDATAKLDAAFGGLRALAELCMERLVRVQSEAPPATDTRPGALRSKWALVALGRGEVSGLSG
jgi:hypothetical protein